MFFEVENVRAEFGHPYGDLCGEWRGNDVFEERDVSVRFRDGWIALQDPFGDVEMSGVDSVSAEPELALQECDDGVFVGPVVCLVLVESRDDQLRDAQIAA